MANGCLKLLFKAFKKALSIFTSLKKCVLYLYKDENFWGYQTSEKKAFGTRTI